MVLVFKEYLNCEDAFGAGAACTEDDVAARGARARVFKRILLEVIGLGLLSVQILI